MSKLKHSRAVALSLSLLPLLLATPGCGGGGGGGGGSLDTVPTLVSVTFLGAGADPVAGDTLRLFLSEPVSLVAGAVLNDADMSITGGSLGTIAGAPVLLSPHVVQVTLGAGVTLTAGTSTLQFGVDNDAVVDSTNHLAGAGTARTLKKADGDDPSVLSVTLNSVDSILNGGGSAGGTLQVGHNGFAIDLAYFDGTNSVDQVLTVVSANVRVSVPGGDVQAGENLAPYLTKTAGATSARFVVPASARFPQGPLTVTCYVVDTTGRVSAAAGFAFLVRTRTDDLQPFETSVNARQVWYIDVNRDVEQYSVNLGHASTPVVVTGAPNSRSDLLDLFRVIGLHSATPIPNVIGSSDSNEVVLAQFKNKVLNELAGFYSGVNVEFLFTAPGSFPSGNTNLGYNSFPFSQICVAGSADVAGTSGVLGLALFDEHNRFQDDDCVTNFNGRRLGVFLHTVINSGFLSGGGTQFRLDFDAFTPARLGNPIGDVTDDDMRLLGTKGDPRETTIANALDHLARFTAVVVAHECGHSMGLVKDGAMPAGLYGGDTTNFPGSGPGHLAMPSSIFPGSAFNIMTPAISYLGALDPATSFNSLNLAYFHEAAIYD